MKFNFCSGSYTSESPLAANDRCVNLIPEVVEIPDAKSKVILNYTPGLTTFATLPDTPVRGIFTVPGVTERLFAVGGGKFYEITSAGAVTERGTVANDGKMASFAATNTQMLIASGATGYTFTFSSNAFTSSPANLTSPRFLGMIDGFFLALKDQSATVMFSLDATTWNALNIVSPNVIGDNLMSLLCDHSEMVLWGTQRATVYQDTGSASQFDPSPSGRVVEQGCGAAFTPVRMDNSVLWWGQDERGGFMAWRSEGYTPRRVSTHAVEFAVQGYTTKSDAISYAYQDRGHSFWVTYFPSANSGRGATWVYDAATGLWHERTFLSGGLEYAHRSNCHAYCFGKHLVGDWNSGNIYQLDSSTYTDFGNDIQRIRRKPVYSDEMSNVMFRRLTLDLEPGLGNTVDPGSNPQVMLRWSNDGGKTWSNQVQASAGKRGEYRKRVFWNRLGASRRRVFELSMTDPIPWRIVDSYLQVEQQAA